jgi:hypothetical protein
LNVQALECKVRHEMDSFKKLVREDRNYSVVIKDLVKDSAQEIKQFVTKTSFETVLDKVVCSPSFQKFVLSLDKNKKKLVGYGGAGTIGILASSIITDNLVSDATTNTIAGGVFGTALTISGFSFILGLYCVAAEDSAKTDASLAKVMGSRIGSEISKSQFKDLLKAEGGFKNFVSVARAFGIAEAPVELPKPLENGHNMVFLEKTQKGKYTITSFHAPTFEELKCRR